MSCLFTAVNNFPSGSVAATETPAAGGTDAPSGSTAAPSGSVATPAGMRSPKGLAVVYSTPVLCKAKIATPNLYAKREPGYYWCPFSERRLIILAILSPFLLLTLWLWAILAIGATNIGNHNASSSFQALQPPPRRPLHLARAPAVRAMLE